MPENLLGDYLRARRERVRPEDVGLVQNGHRRVPGLRREEVALLAGISADYYLRLERGRDRHPSEQVIRALAQVLRLDAAATNYLIGLTVPASAHEQPVREVVDPAIVRLVVDLPVPAFVVGRTWDVLVSNLAARALFPHLAPGHNRLRSIFLDAAERARFVQWESYAARVVANARDHLGRSLDDPRVAALITELSDRSEEFRRLWSRHEVSDRDSQPVILRYPGVGELTLHIVRLAVTGAVRQDLIVFHAASGSADHAVLARLVDLQHARESE